MYDGIERASFEGQLSCRTANCRKATCRVLQSGSRHGPRETIERQVGTDDTAALLENCSQAWPAAPGADIEHPVVRREVEFVQQLVGESERGVATDPEVRSENDSLDLGGRPLVAQLITLTKVAIDPTLLALCLSCRPWGHSAESRVVPGALLLPRRSGAT